MPQKLVRIDNKKRVNMENLSRVIWTLELEQMTVVIRTKMKKTSLDKKDLREKAGQTALKTLPMKTRIVSPMNIVNKKVSLYQLSLQRRILLK